ncbi:hypothetical protein Goklo_022865, partial [Gossypium klotzschianum]|nr:hypothetical protein [Gossypium klotzschianum]
MEDGLANLKIQDGEEEKGVEEEVQQEFCLASEEEDPMEVPLTYSFFWVQVHDLLPEMMSKVVAKQFGDFIGSFIEYYMKQIGKG